MLFRSIAFAPELVTSDLTEQCVDSFGTVGMSAKHRREAVLLIHGPLARLAQSFTRDEVAGVRLGQGAAEGEQGGMRGGGRRLAEHQHDRRHKGVTEERLATPFRMASSVYGYAYEDE